MTNYNNLYFVNVYSNGSSHGVKDGEITGYNAELGDAYEYAITPVSKVTDEAAECALLFGGDADADATEAYNKLAERNDIFTNTEDAVAAAIAAIEAHGHTHTAR